MNLLLSLKNYLLNMFIVKPKKTYKNQFLITDDFGNVTSEHIWLEGKIYDENDINTNESVILFGYTKEVEFN